MDWTHLKEGYWRAEKQIPVGIIVAKVVSRHYLKEHGHYEPADDGVQELSSDFFTLSYITIPLLSE